MKRCLAADERKQFCERKEKTLENKIVDENQYDRQHV